MMRSTASLVPPRVIIVVKSERSKPYGTVFGVGRLLVSLAAMLFLLARSGRIRIKLPSSHHDREDWEDEAATVGAECVVVRQISIASQHATTVATHLVPLPVKEGSYTAIIPPRGKADPEATAVVTLSKTPTIATVSHDEPLMIYKGRNQTYYIKVNPENLNKSRFRGEIVDELPLADVLSSKGNYQPFFLGKEALLFQRREKKMEETTETVILDDDTSNKQAASERPAKKHNFKN